jgi:predicted ATPase
MGMATREQLEVAIAALNAQRGILDDMAIDLAVAPLQAQLDELLRPPNEPVFALPVVRTPLVGRASEMAQLRTVFRTGIESKTLQVVTITGDAGIGKTRLLDEFISWTHSLNEPLLSLRGRSIEEMTTAPYALLRDLLNAHFGIQHEDLPETVWTKLNSGISGLLGTRSAAKVSILGYILGLEVANTPRAVHIPGDVRQLQERVVLTLGQYFAALARQHPLVITLEDIQWSDTVSLDLFEALLPELKASAAMLLFVARPELSAHHPRLAAEPLQVELKPLSNDESRQFIRQTLGKSEPLDEDLEARIIGHAHGNPYYIEEVLRYLIEEGAVRSDTDQGVVDAQKLVSLTLPATLPDLLQWRLGRLSPPDILTLQRAAVVGHTFWDDAVQHSEIDVADILDALHQQALVFPQEESIFSNYAEYMFKHVLLRDVTYSSIPDDVRRVYHGHIARWLVQHGGSQLDDFAGLIGAHFERAGEASEAAKWFARAGELAQRIFAPQAAIQYFQKSLPALSPADRVSVYTRMGEVLRVQVRFDEAKQAFQDALALAQLLGDKAGQGGVLTGLATVYGDMGDYSAMLSSAETLGSISEPASLNYANALVLQGFALLQMGELARTSVVTNEALAIAQRNDAKPAMILALNQLAFTAVMAGRYREAARLLEEALNTARALNAQENIAGTLINLGEIAKMRGDYRTAATLYQEAQSVAQDTGDRRTEMFSTLMLLEVCIRLGEFDAAVPLLPPLIDLAERIQWSMLAGVYYMVTRVEAGLNHIEEAKTAAVRTLALAKDSGVPDLLASAWQAIGLVASASPEPLVIDGQPYSPAGCFEECLRLYTELGSQSDRLYTLRLWARHELERGDLARGESLTREADALETELQKLEE